MANSAEKRVAEALQNMIDYGGDRHGSFVVEQDLAEPNSTYTFEDEGMLTRNAGLVIRMEDGSEFQLTIVQSAYASDEEQFA